MSRLVRYTTTSQAALLVGPGRVVVAAAKAARCPRRWVPEVNGWSIPLDQLDEVLAIIEQRFGGDSIQRVDVA